MLTPRASSNAEQHQDDGVNVVLPLDIWRIIFKIAEYGRQTNWNLGLVNRTFYELSVPILYHAPFTKSLFYSRYEHGENLDDQMFTRLARTLATTPRLADLVRTVHTVWLFKTDAHLIIPFLTGVETVFLSETMRGPFIDLCPSTKLRRVCIFDPELDVAFWLWLYRQRHMEDLETASQVTHDIEAPPNVLPNLQHLSGAANIACALMPARPIRSLSFRHEIQSEASLRELLSYITATVHSLEITLQPRHLYVLFEMVGERAPALTLLKITVDARSPYNCDFLLKEVSLYTCTVALTHPPRAARSANPYLSNLSQLSTLSRSLLFVNHLGDRRPSPSLHRYRMLKRWARPVTR